MDKPLTVIPDSESNKYILVDEYTRYLYGLSMGMTQFPVKYITVEKYISQKANEEKAWRKYNHNKKVKRKAKKRSMKQSA